MNYAEFLESKRQLGGDYGFDPVWMPDFLYGFQRHLVEWAIRKGRAAIFADCGLGKTPMQLVWAENICRKVDGHVLIVAPLAVAAQTVREAQKFGIDAQQSREGEVKPRITVTNYERLHYFTPSDFDGVACDESSAIKQFGGKRKKEVVAFLAKVPYRSLWTATAAPNDYIELGTHSEALGIMGQMDMLSEFFKSTDDLAHAFFKTGDFWNTHKWIFKAHAELSFWRWVCSWARAIRKPSDIGFPDDGFDLKPLRVTQTVVKHSHLLPGELFPVVAKSLKEQRVERRITLHERCEVVKNLAGRNGQSIVWCHGNDEGDHLAKIIPESVQVAGRDTDEHKEHSFIEFAAGNIRTLITKPKIGAWGLNFQNCHHMTFFPSHSFEQYYQGVRRCWRFGQTHPVNVDIVTTEGEAGVTANLNKKAAQAEVMFSRLISEMNSAMTFDKKKSGTLQPTPPAWL